MADRRHAAQRAESDAENVTELPEKHAVTQCEECEQWDDHPKLHYGAKTMHHDCVPASVRRDVLGDGSLHSVTDAATRAAFEGADRGLRGAELRAHIRSTHSTEAPKAEAARAAAAEAGTADQEGE